MVQLSFVQLRLHYLSSTQIDDAETQFLPPEIFDYFSAVLELTYSPAHP